MSDQNANSNVQDKKTKVVEKINEIKKNVETFVSDINVNEIKSSLNKVMKEAQTDFNKLVDKDLITLKKKFNQEKSLLEKKAKKFLDNHKKEIKDLQYKFEKLVKKTKSKKAAPLQSAHGTKKKVSKKVAKVAKKIAKKK